MGFSFCEGWNSGYKMGKKNVYSGISVGANVGYGSGGLGGGLSGTARWTKIDCCLSTADDGTTGSANACNFDKMNPMCVNNISYTRCQPITLAGEK